MLPAFSWTGFYAGLNGGWTRESFNWRYTNPVPPTIQGANTSFDRDNAIVGIHGGYNLQWNWLVLGAEASLSTPTGGNFASSIPGCVSVAGSLCQARMSTLVTAGGRLGLAYNNWLFYGSGGWASANAATRELTVPPAVFDTSQAHRHDGWYAGGGVEWAFLSSLIFGVEYLHVDLNTRYHASSADLFGPSPPGVNGRNLSPSMDIVRARLSLLLGGGPLP